MHHRWFLAWAVVLGVLSSIRADVAVPEPGPDRLALADYILVGKVVAIEPVDVEVSVFPGSKDKVKYRVAVVNVTEVVLGKKETKTLRVGFMPPREEKEPPIRRRYPDFGFRLNAGSHGLMYLRRHPGESIFVGRMSFDFVPYQEVKEGQLLPSIQWGVGPYPVELANARAVAKIFADPVPALKAKDQAERFTAASYLISRYRMPTQPGMKVEPITSEESKLIFAAILEHDWNAPRRGLNAWQCFHSIGLTEKDGWKTPAKINSANDLRSAAQVWFRDHGQDYRIQRFVK